MRICAECGVENPEGARFCNGCAAPLTKPAVARRKLATLVFCDVAGSTAMGERVDPEAVRESMLAYFGQARAVLERHGGTVEKFIGDAVVAAFGVPTVHEDDALRACRAALEIQERMRTRISLRIGVNTGEVVTGDPSSRQTFVTGDAVNVAARLEQAAAPGEVLLGEETYQLVRDAVRVEAVEPLRVKGKSEPLAAYRLLAIGEQAVRHESPLVGRGGELQLLEREFDASRSGCRLVTMVGEPGVGKSRLVAAFLDRARARPVRGACLSYGEGITFWPVAEIVRELEPDSARLPPRIAQLLGVAEGTATEDQIAEAIAEFLAAHAPLVAVFDDIHWAEPTLLDLLATLPARIGDAPVLIVCLARPELLEARPEWGASLRLEPLGVVEVEALLEGLGAPVGVRVRIAQAAAGNPLYAEELVAWARDGGSLDELPASLSALLGARLDQLDPEARAALERGAIEGELFHQAAVVELSETADRPLVPSRLEAMTRKDLLRLAGAIFVGEAAFRFKHILFRDAAYAATSKKQRAVFHEQFASWLERYGGDRVAEYEEIIGYHLEQAYRYKLELGTPEESLAERAARHLGSAGVRANHRGDVRAAAGLLGCATGLLPPDSLERLELLIPYGYALRESGRGREHEAVGRELYERATALGERRLAAHGEAPHLDGESPDEARARLEQAVATFAELGDESGLAQAKRKLGLFLGAARGRDSEALRVLEEAFAHAAASGDLLTRRAITISLARNLAGGSMPVEDAQRRLDELRRGNEDDRVLDAVILRFQSGLAAMAGRFDDSRELERRAARVLDEANMVQPSWVTSVDAAYASELAGDTAAAERHYVVRENFARGDGHSADGAVRLALLYCDEGRWQEADRCLADYRHLPYATDGISVNSPNRPGVVGLRLAGEARLAAHRGELDRAAALAAEAVETIDLQEGGQNSRAKVRLALAEVERAAGRPDEADAAIAAAIELYEQKGNVAAAARVRASLVRV